MLQASPAVRHADRATLHHHPIMIINVRLVDMLAGQGPAVSQMPTSGEENNR